MAEEKEVKKKTTTNKKTTTKKTTTKKTITSTTKRKTTPKKVEEVKEEVIETPVEKISNTVQEVAETVTAPVKDIINGDIKKKPSFVIFIFIILLIAFMVLVSIFSYYNRDGYTSKGDFTEIGTFEERVFYEDYYSVNNIDELESLFPHKYINNIDFNKYNYVVLSFNIDPCSEKNITPIGYKIDNNTLSVKATYEASCGGCKPEYLYYLLKLDKDTNIKNVEYDYEATNDPHCDPYVAYKPIIYLYPEVETNVSIKLGNDNYLTTTYPKYNNGWNVTALPDGTLKDSNRTYYGLFWEGNNHNAYIHDEGFVIKGEDTLAFLEEKLEQLGLNEREANEFIIYWLPQLENNIYNYIYFETIDEINNYMPLDINPNPDNIIRIQMDYKPLNKMINVKEQIINTPNRNGFTLVEWGGSIIKD